MPLMTELRKEIEQRLASLEKQTEVLRKTRGDDAIQTAVHLDLLQREQVLRKEQLQRGRA